MTLFVLKDKRYLLYSLNELNRLALKKIFELKNMSLDDERTLEKGIMAWAKRKDLSHKERREIRAIIRALEMNENKEFDKKKDIYKKTKVNYFHVRKKASELAKEN